tara:strand:- start:1059 stop:1436 length:378 start_codon:yes stop_codon:yes gene_type:complete
MSKLGCSLKEAFGDSWTAGPKYYQTLPQNFRTTDPYSTNIFKGSEQDTAPEEFTQKSTEDEERIKLLEAKVEEMSKPVMPVKNVEPFTQFLDNARTGERLDNVVRFALVSILVSNFIDLMSSSSN